MTGFHQEDYMVPKTYPNDKRLLHLNIARSLRYQSSKRRYRCLRRSIWNKGEYEQGMNLIIKDVAGISLMLSQFIESSRFIIYHYQKRIIKDPFYQTGLMSYESGIEESRTSSSRTLE